MNNSKTEGSSDNILSSADKEMSGITVNYRLYCSRIDSENRDSYSVSVTSCFNNNTETVLAKDISSERERASEIFSLISENFVTPCTLFDILEDIL